MVESTKPKEKKSIHLTGAQETLLITLYDKWVDFYSPTPILADRWAAETLESIEGKQEEMHARLKNTPMRISGALLRARTLDSWTAEFLKKHDNATVVHLACGLDSRVMRMRDNFGSQVRWIDVDMPDVAEVRRELDLPVPESRDGFTYELIGSSVTQSEWLERIPMDRPTAIVFEGLTMYLATEDGESLVKRVVSHFKSGELIFDSMTPLMRFLCNFLSKRMGGFRVTFGWAVGSWRAIAKLHPKLQMLQSYTLHEAPASERFPWHFRALWCVMSWVPMVRSFFLFQHFRF